MRWPRIVPMGLLALAIAGCGGSVVEEKEPKGDGSCIPTERFFAQSVWQAFMAERCMSCHRVGGLAGDSALVLAPPSQTDYLRINLETLERIAEMEVRGTSVLLLKPVGELDHGGLQQIQPGSAEYQALEELVRRFREPVRCTDGGGGEGLDGIELMGAQATLRKASLSLVGRLPTPEEEARVAEEGEAALEPILRDMLREEAFFDRLKEWWNDLLLTDVYASGSRAIDLLDANDYPQRYWFQPPEGATDVDQQEVTRLRNLTNRAIAREPLELVAHVVRNHRPFTEILTADYRMVNPYSARSYGVSVDFEDPEDPNEWREARLPGIEQAGILSSPMFLNRYPTTPTNRNRNRSRVVYKLFLATDLLKLAERPVDPTNLVGHNPTLYNPECTICHEPMDPVAGTFMNWDARGRYRPPADGWYTDMRPPGFKDAVLPVEERGRALEWLARQIVADPLFVTSTVHNAWTMLTGQQPLQPPKDPTEPGAAERLEAWERQNDFFQQVGRDFVEDGYDFKTLLVRLILGPYYRIENAAAGMEGEPRFADLGPSRLLTPEMLDRKILAVTGYPWRSNPNATPYLLDGNYYRIFYGGIDSDTVIERIVAPNGVMANVAARMANEMACRAVPQDFAKDAADRRLFPAVEISYEPEDPNGFPIPGAIEAIKENIRYLHARVLGEELFPGDPELDRTWELFYETWKEGKAKVAAGELDRSLPWNCRARADFFTGEEYPEGRRVERDDGYTIRAWMAVMTYLLLDYRFLYE